MENYNAEIKTLIKCVREAIENTFSDVTKASYETQIELFREVLKMVKHTDLDTTQEIIDILDVSMNATDTDLDDLQAEFETVLDKINDRDDDQYLELPCGDVRIIDKEESDQIWTDSLIEQTKECYDLSNVPKFVAIDWQKTAENCKVDGRGHHFASYDGNEHETDTVYIFRTN